MTVFATMGIIVDEDDLGGSSFLVGVLLYLAAALLHCRRPRRLVPLVAGFGAGFAVMFLVILLAIAIGPHHAGSGDHWGWRDAALGIGMTLLMSFGALNWCLGTNSLRRAARWTAIPLLSGTAASVLPVPVIHDNAAAVAMGAALLVIVLSDAVPEQVSHRPAPVDAGQPGGADAVPL
ncbi:MULTISPECIES: hypothetical protein [Tsukamurella]|uniref:Uncharacterized protein n=2 Tax=Tsukamurella TaxID=2060 RepID=A0A5C5S4S4_9ACTN|nr:MULTISPECIES: hypothetical protein [Tsukamurella]NMD56877.1 hypothetical protein [Tsukamurella columbiensis]TWS29780.1 hypothetical protein FK530_04390 [Tsukamurella conjunctivitidis]